MEESKRTPKPAQEKKEPTELEKLVEEKVTLSKKLGIMRNLEPVKDYKETDEYKRIQEIDKQLWELVK
ncbi:hypothetical protein [Paenibacillus macerans]|uniref:hypothetical protein n=1 Tax=Paenibacillus macerans TaxID=44252 RepID=UPI003D318395